jgi:hypothetical protein
MPHAGEYLTRPNFTRATGKTTIVDLDSFYGTNSEDSNRIMRMTWGNIKEQMLANPNLTGNVFVQQGASTVKAGAATLTAAELLTQTIEYTGGAASLTMPTGTDLDAGILAGALANDRAFDFSILNRGAGIATLATAAGITLTGLMTVAASTSGLFRCRKTATNTFIVTRRT